ncbi:MAG: sulfite exporter TauE/SafE family protein [Magnetococcales bacterium]|nr:sulfite exporter TauE/SafE family protein [Magnetococcales bacterium]
MGIPADPAWLTVALFLILGSLVQGAVGFGAALVAAPVTMLLRPDLVPGALMVAAFSANVAQATRDWQGLHHWPILAWLLAGLLPGFLLGATALAVLPPRETAFLFGGAVLVAVALSLGGWTIRPRPITLLPAGFLSGFMSITTTMGGPPLALLFQDLPGPLLRGLLAVVFTVGGLLAMTVLHGAGLLGWTELREGAWLIPFPLTGLLLSRPLARWLDRGRVRSAVLLLAGASGLGVILKALLAG